MRDDTSEWLNPMLNEAGSRGYDPELMGELMFQASVLARDLPGQTSWVMDDFSTRAVDWIRFGQLLRGRPRGPSIRSTRSSAEVAKMPRTEQMARIASTENAILSDLVAQIRAGHTAAARYWDDEHSEPDWRDWHLAHDDEVEAQVTFSRNGSRRDAKLPLRDVGRLIEAGTEIEAVEAPYPKPIVWFAVAAAQGAAIVAQDHGGFGRMVTSRIPTPDGSFGRWMAGYASRSGVPQVNHRRQLAQDQLRKEYGTKRGSDLVENIVAGEVVSWFAASEPLFVVRSRDQIVSQSGTIKRRQAVADVIAKALSLEAFGVTEPQLPSARHRHESLEQPGDSPFPGTGRITAGDWTTSQLAHDSVGVIASGIVDGTANASYISGMTGNVDSLLESWEKAGLRGARCRSYSFNSSGTPTKNQPTSSSWLDRPSPTR